MSDTAKEFSEIFRMEFEYTQALVASSRGPKDIYLLGVADGISIMASHLGIALRSGPPEEVKE